jgi:hypothetical protein
MSSPQQNRSCLCMFTADDAARVQALIPRLGGVKRTRTVLGVSTSTFDAVRERGRVMRTTRERLLEALSREEAAL